MAARKELVRSVFEWQAASTAPAAPAVNVAVDLVMAPAMEEGGGQEAPSPAGRQVCELAEGLDVRAVVMAHHGRGMARSMQCGPVTLHVTKFCPRPLTVIYPERTAAAAAALTSSNL